MNEPTADPTVEPTAEPTVDPAAGGSATAAGWRWRAAVAAGLGALLLLVATATTVRSLATYCLTTDAGNVRALAAVDRGAGRGASRGVPAPAVASASGPAPTVCVRPLHADVPAQPGGLAMSPDAVSPSPPSALPGADAVAADPQPESVAQAVFALG